MMAFSSIRRLVRIWVLVLGISIAGSHNCVGDSAPPETQRYGPPPPERTVTFPNEAIGRLGIADWDKVLVQDADGREIGSAQGRVVVPKGKQLLLIFFDPAQAADRQREGPVSLSALDSLPPEDLQGLYVPFAHITPPEAARIARFISLRHLSFGPLSSATDACLAPVAKLKTLETFYVTETQITDAGLEHLKGLTHLKVLDLFGTEVTGSGLRYLRDLTELRGLELGLTKVDDAGLPSLTGLRHLTRLGLWGTAVTDEGLAHLQGLSEMRSLHLGYGPVITDEGLKHLTQMKRLEWLELGDTRVTSAGVERLKEAVPSLKYVGTAKSGAGRVDPTRAK